MENPKERKLDPIAMDDMFMISMDGRYLRVAPYVVGPNNYEGLAREIERSSLTPANSGQAIAILHAIYSGPREFVHDPLTTRFRNQLGQGDLALFENLFLTSEGIYLRKDPAGIGGYDLTTLRNLENLLRGDTKESEGATISLDRSFGFFSGNVYGSYPRKPSDNPGCLNAYKSLRFQYGEEMLRLLDELAYSEHFRFPPVVENLNIPSGQQMIQLIPTLALYTAVQLPELSTKNNKRATPRKPRGDRLVLGNRLPSDPNLFAFAIIPEQSA